MIIIAGGFGQWESWSTCSVTCGHGTTQRRRFCDSPCGECPQNLTVAETQPCFDSICSEPVLPYVSYRAFVKNCTTISGQDGGLSLPESFYDSCANQTKVSVDGADCTPGYLVTFAECNNPCPLGSGLQCQIPMPAANDCGGVCSE